MEEDRPEQSVCSSQASDSTIACECREVELEEDRFEVIVGVASLSMIEPVVHRKDCMVETVLLSMDT